MSHRSRLLLISGLAALGLGFAACGGDDDDEEQPAAPERLGGTFVGKVAGTNAYFALISDGEQVAGYVCDGDAEQNSVSISTWIVSSPIDGDRVELIDREGSTLGDATITADGATGEITLNGEVRAFTAEPATGEAGLYRGAKGDPEDPEEVEAGQVVLNDGTARGAIDLDGRVSSFINETEPFNVQTPSGSVRLSKISDPDTDPFR